MRSRSKAARGYNALRRRAAHLVGMVDTARAGARHRRTRRALFVRDDGPGGPILVLVQEPGFSRYLVEMLRAEGVSSFRVAPVAAMTPSLLAEHDVVLLGPASLSPRATADLTAWVEGGGSLVAIRPDPVLAPLLGLEPTPGGQVEGYLQVDTTSAPGHGISGRPMQLHGKADHYRLAGATAVAGLLDRDRTPTGFPAVTMQVAGATAGFAVAFAYDLAASIVYTRQGNPEWAGQNRDGDLVTRSNDLFFGASLHDPQRDWVDPDLLDLPQADEQQRLLVQLIQHISAPERPLLRFWYLPRELRAVVVMTGDDHALNGTAERFAAYAALDRPGDSPEDWTDIRATSYIYAGGSSLSSADAAAFAAQGFEICPHVTTGAMEWTTGSLSRAYRRQLAAFGRKYPEVPQPVSHRTHAVVWSDWATQAEIERANGIRLDTNYYYYPAPWVAGRTGFFTGSGLPMRFATTAGDVIDCYQATTLLTDESEQVFPEAITVALDRALRPDGHVTVLTANMHTDLGVSIGSDAIVAAARRRGVPVISARQLLTWIDARAASSVRAVQSTGTRLRFSVAAPPDARHLTLLVPAPTDHRGVARATRDGEPVPVAHDLIGGVVHAIVPAATGSYELEWDDGPTPPTILGLTATAASPSEIRIEWRSSLPMDGRVTITPDDGGAATAIEEGAERYRHAVTARGLLPGCTYRVGVCAGDAQIADVVVSTPHEPVEHGRREQFQSGTCSGTLVSVANGGSLILEPELWLEPSADLGPEWLTPPGASCARSEDGTALLVRGAILSALPVASGRSLEVAASLHFCDSPDVIGFADCPEPETLVAFMTDPAAKQLTATICVGGSRFVRPIPGKWDTAPHRFRVEWDRGLSTFSIDGRTVLSERALVVGPLRPLIGGDPGGTGLRVLWARASSFCTSGSFTSEVVDHGSPVRWGPITLTGPALTLTGARTAFRSGDTPVPDHTWSTWTDATTDEGPTTPPRRYLQYRVDLCTASGRWTPEVIGVTIQRAR